MERIQILISRLKEQAAQTASPSQMLVTVQMLQNELYQLQASGNYTLGTSKVAVMLPKTINISLPEEITQKAPAPVEKLSIVDEEPAYSRTRTTPKRTEQSNLLFDPLFEIPTLSHQPVLK